MKVTSQNIASTIASAAANTNKAEEANKSSNSSKTEAAALKAGNIASSSKVDLSEKAQMMKKAKEMASTPMDVNEAKVARLQKMIDEGSYNVDSASIADRLVDEHLNFS